MGTYIVNADHHREVEWNADQTRIIKKKVYNRGDEVEVSDERAERLLAQGAIVEQGDYDEDVRRPEVEETAGAGSTPPAPADLVSTPPDSGAGDSDGLKGQALDDALDERGLSKAGTADEKRARVAEYDAENEDDEDNS